MAAGNKKNASKTKKNTPLVILLIALIVILTLLLGSMAMYMFVIKPQQDREVQGGKREAQALQGSLNVMTPEEIQEALNNIVEEGMFRISIASNIVAIEDGPAEVRIENNLTNRYVMQVSIYLDETEEEIYSTDLIDPGYYIEKTEFDKHLDPGEYAATAMFTAFYPDTEEIVGTVGANVRILVYPKETPTPTPTIEPTPTPPLEPAVTDVPAVQP